MRRAATTIWAGLAVALGTFSGTAAAQTVGAEDEPTPEVAPAADETPSMVPAETLQALLQCEQARTSLADIVIRLRGHLDGAREACEARIAAVSEELSEQLTFCRERETLNRRTNMALDEQLRACRAEPQQDPAIVQALADAEAEIEALTARLAELGYSAEAGFGYVGGDAWGSFATTVDLPRLLQGLPRLAEADCADALDWLDAQDGSSRPLRRVIWVWRDDRPVLCARDRDGVAVIQPRANDEAHAIVFQ